MTRLTPPERLALAARSFRSLTTVNRRCNGTPVNAQTEASLRAAAQQLGLELPPLQRDTRQSA